VHLSGGEIRYRNSNPSWTGCGARETHLETGRLDEVRTSSQCSRGIIAILHAPWGPRRHVGRRSASPGSRLGRSFRLPAARACHVVAATCSRLSLGQPGDGTAGGSVVLGALLTELLILALQVLDVSTPACYSWKAGQNTSGTSMQALRCIRAPGLVTSACRRHQPTLGNPRFEGAWPSQQNERLPGSPRREETGKRRGWATQAPRSPRLNPTGSILACEAL
jgi:hypothetical protein